MGRRTIAFARKWLTQVKIFEEWTDGCWDPTNSKKREALQSIMDNIGKGWHRAGHASVGTGQAMPNFQVQEDAAGVWFLQDMSQQ